MPCIECKDVDKCCAASALLQSIALEEAAIAHILNAEGEKLQKAISISCDQKDLIEVTIVGLCSTYIKNAQKPRFSSIFNSGPEAESGEPLRQKNLPRPYFDYFLLTNLWPYPYLVHYPAPSLQIPRRICLTFCFLWTARNPHTL